MKFLKREDAVSPVIGVILMVAITVILAAVIAAFVFGMASGVSKTKSVAVTAKKIGPVVALTYQGGQDDPLLAGITAQFVDNGTVFCYNSAGAGTGLYEQLPTAAAECPATLIAANKPAVGASMTTSSSPAGSFSGTQVHSVVTGVFTDGSSQVILDTYV
ncbi:MAG: type IV pilin N-terminal domain-containing protein [Methanomicrobiales archaeon]|nr:type IV pilin N-terminal domain-containing protein [Methanomicrobiales archaeon]